jgi:outer membrane protein
MFRSLVRPAALGALALALTTSLVARADGQRIGYFDVKRVLSELEEAKSARSRLEADFKKKQKQLDEQKAVIEKAQKEFEQQQAVLAPAAREAKQRELVQKLESAQRTYMELQQDLAAQEQNALGGLIERLAPVVGELAEAEGYAFVFEKGEAGLFYGRSADDLTSQVIRRYNQKFAGKPAASAKKSGDKK